MTKKTKAKKPTQPKTAPKAKKPPASPAIKAALAAVRTMPKSKESKLDMLVRLMSRPEGATLDDLIAATGWQQHTLRSAISYALGKKRGYQISTSKPNGVSRTYKIVPDKQ